MRSWFQTTLILSLAMSALLVPAPSRAADFVVYSIYKQLDMGNPGETPQKDFYVNMGTQNGLRAGSTVDVIRKVSTYDAITEKLYREISFKIGTLKIIHAEGNAAVGRLEKLLPADKIPASSIQGVMIGDIVRPSGE